MVTLSINLTERPLRLLHHLLVKQYSFAAHGSLILSNCEYLRLHGLDLAAHLLVLHSQHINRLIILLGQHRGATRNLAILCDEL